MRASLVQVTNLGHDGEGQPAATRSSSSPASTTARRSRAARVSLVRRDNAIFWTGTTGADGVATGPGSRSKKTAALATTTSEWQRPHFIAIAEKDGDIAYTASDWNEGIEPWDFGTSFNRSEADPMLRGSIFSDRGVYRLGEEIHFKAILRQNAPDGVRLLRSGTPVFVTVRDGQDRVVDERTVTVNSWSSAEWTLTLPAEGALGTYSVRAILESDKPKPRTSRTA